MLSRLMTSFEERQNELVTIHGSMETVESTLNDIEETLYRGKAMRSVIMW
jgi:exonuclease VII small subunit